MALDCFRQAGWRKSWRKRDDIKGESILWMLVFVALSIPKGVASDIAIYIWPRDRSSLLTLTIGVQEALEVLDNHGCLMRIFYCGFQLFQILCRYIWGNVSTPQVLYEMSRLENLVIN